MDDQDAAFEIEHGHGDYTDGELLEQARANAQALVIATTKFLQEREIALEAWTGAIGCIFAQGWDEPRPWDAGEFLDAMLTNYRALGATVESVELAPDRAEAVTSGFPDPDLCAVFDVDPALAARFHDAPAPIARDRNLDWTWTFDGERTRLVATRSSG
jgi:hypothetical protein